MHHFNIFQPDMIFKLKFMDSKEFQTLEKYFFILITGLNLIPVLSGKFFPTLDGAAHLYNSNLLNNLLFKSYDQLNLFFILNQEPVPNWTGHFMLSFFNLFLPAFAAEKGLLLFYMIGLPFSFRALIKTISFPNNLFSYLIFPFTYSFLFFLGFYNFSIALIFILITINFWIKNERNIGSLKNIFILFLLIALTYFSHIFVFAILMLFISLHLIAKVIIQILQEPDQIKNVLFGSVRKVGILLLSSALPFGLFFYYFYSRPLSGEYTYLEQSELIEWLTIIRPIIALYFIEEAEFTTILFYLILSAFVIAVFKKVISIKLNPEFCWRTNFSSVFRSLIGFSDFWLFGTMIILLIYLKLPDSDGSAGFVSVRLGLIFFLFLIIWLSTQHFPKWFNLLLVGIVLFCNFKLNQYYISATKDLNKLAIECVDASKHILPNSIVLPLNYSENWFHEHFSNYLGINKPMIILENYECGTGYFPIKWNKKTIPNTLFGNLDKNQLPCLKWESNIKNASKKIDYIFVLGNMELKNDSCNQAIKQNVLENYFLIHKSENSLLFRNSILNKI